MEAAAAAAAAVEARLAAAAKAAEEAAAAKAAEEAAKAKAAEEAAAAAAAAAEAAAAATAAKALQDKVEQAQREALEAAQAVEQQARTAAAPKQVAKPSDGELQLVTEQAWFYLSEDGERQGPLEVTDLTDLCADSVVTLDTPVWSKLTVEWKQLEQVEALCWLVQQAAPSDEAAIWYALDGAGERLGPLTALDLRPLLAAATITAESAVWSQALGEWQRMCDVPRLAPVLAARAPPRRSQ